MAGRLLFSSSPRVNPPLPSAAGRVPSATTPADKKPENILVTVQVGRCVVARSASSSGSDLFAKATTMPREGSAGSVSA